MNPQDEYKEAFGLGSPANAKKAKNAHELALDLRKFEIGLYWQRAAYFWTLIAVAFAGYFAVFSAEKLPSPDREFFAYVIGCIGLLFTWAWYLVNRGSKYWQENWENHVDMLEDDVVGPLYKTVLSRSQENQDFFDKHIVAPAPISVSKVNLLVSMFTLCIWVLLVFYSLPPFHLTSPISWWRVAVAAVTLFFGAVARSGTKTSFAAHQHVMHVRKTEIVPK